MQSLQVSSYWHLVALRLLLGIGEAVFNPVALATIAAVFPFEQRARALSIFYTGVYLGGGFGYLAGAANTTLGWRNTFLLFGTPGIALGLLYLLVGRRADRIESAETDRSQAPKLGIFTALWYVYLLYKQYITISAVLMRMHVGALSIAARFCCCVCPLPYATWQGTLWELTPQRTSATNFL
jgi:MFS family permease